MEIKLLLIHKNNKKTITISFWIYSCLNQCTNNELEKQGTATIDKETLNKIINELISDYIFNDGYNIEQEYVNIIKTLKTMPTPFTIKLL